MAPNPLTTSTTSPLQGHLREYHYLIIALISPNKILGASMYPAGSERPVPSTPFIDPLHPCFPPTHTHSGTHRPLLSLFSSTRPTYISMSLALAGLYRQRERRDRVLVFRAQWGKKGEGASKQQREREREWEGGDSEIERRKKHKEGEKYKRRTRETGGKRGEGRYIILFISLS